MAKIGDRGVGRWGSGMNPWGNLSGAEFGLNFENFAKY